MLGTGTDDPKLLLEFLERYDPTCNQYETIVKDLIDKSIHYYRDYITPNKQFRSPSESERVYFKEIVNRLSQTTTTEEKELQTIPFDVARAYNVQPNEVFRGFYEVLFGQERGPRFGTFARLLGKERVIQLLNKSFK